MKDLVYLIPKSKHNKEDLFTTIPEKTNCRIYEFDKNNNVSQEQR